MINDLQNKVYLPQSQDMWHFLKSTDEVWKRCEVNNNIGKRKKNKTDPIKNTVLPVLP